MNANTVLTEHNGVVVITLASNSGDPGFDSQQWE
jgi:hypothetical protein